MKTKKERIKTQLGCGYCEKEKTCKKRDGKTNFAKQGCKEFNHWENETKESN